MCGWKVTVNHQRSKVYPDINDLNHIERIFLSADSEMFAS
jgi:hypothetical protein